MLFWCCPTAEDVTGSHVFCFSRLLRRLLLLQQKSLIFTADFSTSMAFLARTSMLRSAAILNFAQRSLNLTASRGLREAKLFTIITGADGRRFCSSHETAKNVTSAEEDLPDPTMENPFLKEKRCCILCRYDIHVDYKNVRLLTQFVSPFTGRMYDKHITGLCETQHRAVRTEIGRSVRFGLMSPWYRDPKYANDPKLFDPTRPQRANPY